MKKILCLFLLLIVSTILSACNVDETEHIIPELNEEETQEKEESYLYNDFTPSEKNLLKEFINMSIPFIPNNEYYFEIEDRIIKYYTIGNSTTEFEGYKTKLAELGFTNTEWHINNGFTFEKDKVIIILNSFVENEQFIIEMYISLKNVEDDSNDDNNTDDTNPEDGYITGPVCPVNPDDIPYEEAPDSLEGLSEDDIKDLSALKKAFDNMEYIANSPADAHIYYKRKKERDQQARRKYRETKSMDNIKNELFIIDIIREGMKQNDSRLR